MLKYTVKRILFFIPAVFFISVLSFMLIRAVPGDTVDFIIRSSTDETANRDSPENFKKKYREKAAELGTSLPAFYISLGQFSKPKELAYEWNPVRKEICEKLIDQTGNADASLAWYNQLERMDNAIQKFGSRSKDPQAVIDAGRISQAMLYSADRMELNAKLDELSFILETDSAHKAYTRQWIIDSRQALEKLETAQTNWKNYIPVLHFHAQSAYGIWLWGNGKNQKGILRGDFGNSILDGKPVSSSMGERLGLTLLLSLISVILSYLIAVPLGLISAVYQGTFIEKGISTLTFLLFALPSFWVAGLSIIWLAGGDGLDWFSPYGAGEIVPGMSLAEILHERWKHFALPIFAWTYGGIAFITQQTKTAVLENMGQLFTRSAIARGLPFKTILFKHVLPNSLRPLITMLANILPGLIGGSVILETIFSLPGLGEWAYRAFLYRDFPVIMAVLFWSSLLTLSGYLISDILLAFTDPKIRFHKPQNRN